MTETLKILLDNSNHTCRAGQILSGKVECVFSTNKKLRAIRLHIQGIAKTEWNVNFGPMIQKKYSTKETHLSYHCDLIEGNGTDVLIPAGTHTYPFSNRLSSRLPSSFEGEYGNVCYKIKVRLRPDDGNETVLPFRVVSPIDLNAFPKLKEPFHYKANGEIKFCFYNSGPMKITISLPYTGYAIGQKINVHSYIKNTSSINVEHVKLKLVRIIRYKTLQPSISRRHSRDVIATCTENAILAYTEKSWTSILDFSQTELINLLVSKIMDITYQLQVQVVLPFPYADLNINCPIMLGTIPLRRINQDLPEEPVILNSNPRNPVTESFPALEGTSTDHGRYNLPVFSTLSVPHLQTSDLPTYEEAMNLPTSSGIGFR